MNGSRDIRALEERLQDSSYEEINDELSLLNEAPLLQLLDSSSVKVGDTAASLLFRRGIVEPVIHAVMKGQVRTKLGKIRATNILNWRGKQCPSAVQLCLHLLADRSSEVVSNALFGLVFRQDKQFIEPIQQAMTGLRPGSKHYQTCAAAIEALEKQDPFLFSPHFRDSGNVWRLDPNRFGHKIG